MNASASFQHILVTGGCGFIGSWLVKALLNSPQGYSVTNLDNLSYAANPENLDPVASHSRYQFVHGDIRDVQLVQELMRHHQVCINVAAQTHVDRSIEGPEVFVSTNVTGTATLLEAARQSPGFQRFIQISTDEVYGSLGPTGLFTEQSPIQPSSPYSASKASADLIAQSYFTTYGLPVLITRCSNNYGPNQYPEKLIPFFILKAMRGETLPVYGDGLNVRDWIHVQDHVEGVMAVLERGTPGEVYNIGASCEKTNLDITHTLLRHLNQPDTLIEYVTDRLGHDRRYAMDSSYIQNKLGWSAQVPFESGLAETVAWYQNHRGWIERILSRKEEASVQKSPAQAGVS